MSINQAIYTSSAHGINKGGGLGIHTFNYLCSEEELREFELSFCQYYFQGSDQNIEDLPVKLIYGKIRTGQYMEACVTYLGKDYDKERGRMGNILSHMFSFAKEDISVYPVQLYGSPDYMTSIAQEEVDGSKDVEYLPEKKTVSEGSIVSIDVVQEFLSDGRLEMLCHMVNAVLHRDNVHKVIIYDTHENIIKWIAAVEFSLPLICAMDISFSSYERDPMMSEYDIRGAVVGLSSGNCHDYAVGGQFYVFDGVNMDYPKFDISDDYFRYGIKMGLAFSYDSLTEFFKFTNAYISYSKADTDIFNGFKLFQMIQGGVDQIKIEEYNGAVDFEEKYGNLNSYENLLERLFEKLPDRKISNQNAFDNITTLLYNFFEKALSLQDVSFGMSLIEKLDFCIVENGFSKKTRDDIWHSMLEVIQLHQSKYIGEICEYLIETNNYLRLAELEAGIYQRHAILDDEKTLKAMFSEYWMHAKEQCHYFDRVIWEAIANIKQRKSVDEQYYTFIDLFLLVQELGEGNIYGAACEQLISTIDARTCISAKKLFVRTKKDNEYFEKKQARCAFEAFNYVQKNKVMLPIAKIRLLHLGRCIAKACEDEIALQGSKAIGIYTKYPVDATQIDAREFEIYITQLTGAIRDVQINWEEYRLLLTVWLLTIQQKESLIKSFMDCEMDYFRKEKDLTGMVALLNAILVLDDPEYDLVLNNYVVSIKQSLRQKISEILNNVYEKELYSFWKHMEYDGHNKKERKSAFGFGKRQ